MGLWQNLCEAYTANEEMLQKEYPLSTTTINNSSSPLIVIVLDQNGNLRNVYEIPKKGKAAPMQSFVIPVTEESMGRTGKKDLPHPLFDQYAYLKGSGTKFEMYLASLERLQDVDPAFKSVYQYTAKRSIEKDVKEFNPTDKEFILFEVEIPGHANSQLWKDQDLMLKWHQYYMKEAYVLLVQQKKDEQHMLELKIAAMDKVNAKKAKTKLQRLREEIVKLPKETVYCDDMITGQHVARAISHPKKVVNTGGNSNAKLISANDTTNFTFRGRFENSEEAFAVGYDSSQRAHQFLRYIVNERGIMCEGQVIVSFTTAKTESNQAMPLPSPPVSDTELDWDSLEDENTLEQNNAAILAAQAGGNFAAALKSAITGYKANSILSAHLHDPTMIIILDAPTNGRLSVKFYREMTREDYLERLLAWHEQCQWVLPYPKRDEQSDKGRRITYVGAPSVDSINNLINGRSHGDKSYNTFKKQTREVLMRCIFDNAPFPQNYLVQAIRRASTPLANAMVNDKFSRDVFLQNIAIACALVNKSLIDNEKEKYKMSLDDSCCVRDYLYGRLLGAADELEEYALRKKGKKRTETAAIRYMQTFSQKPFTTWKVIHDALTPYLQQVKNSIAANEIQVTMVKFLSGEFENDSPLNGLYLLGYYCERAHIEEMVAQLKTNNEKENNE